MCIVKSKLIFEDKSTNLTLINVSHILKYEACLYIQFATVFLSWIFNESDAKINKITIKNVISHVNSVTFKTVLFTVNLFCCRILICSRYSVWIQIFWITKPSRRLYGMNLLLYWMLPQMYKYVYFQHIYNLSCAQYW